MDVEFDSSWVLYGIGVFTSAVSIAVFGTSNVLRFSPVTRSLILMLVSLGLVVSGIYVRDRFVSASLYSVSAFSYLFFSVGVSDVWGGAGAMVLSLSLMSAGFMALGYLVSHGRPEIGREKVRLFVALVMVLIFALAGFDLAGGKTSYSLELRDSVKVPAEPGLRDVRLGKLRVSNGFVLPRVYEEREYDACVYSPGRRDASLDQEPAGYDIERLGGGETVEVSLNLKVHEREENVSISGNYRVVRASECPTSSSVKKIVVIRDSEDRRVAVD